MKYLLLVALVNALLSAVLMQGLDDISKKSNSKPTDFKAKLAKSEFADSIKGTKLSASRFDDFGDSTLSELGITLPPDQINDTIKEDHHTYYNSTFYASPEGKRFWIDLDKFPKEQVITHEMLSDSHRQATTIDLSFEFPFYGNLLNSTTIATGGFLYMGDYLHNWIAATQYIAPLMANFDTSASNDSVIKYYDNGTALTIQWHKVFIQDNADDGPFTFQVTLVKTGDIIFAYKELPYAAFNISDTKHPVKIGLSDAYILEKSMFFIRRKTIYEYHRINMLDMHVSNDSAFYFTALPTCMGFKDCDTCMAANSKLGCSWCEAIQRCSDGIDRQRQSWVTNGCIIMKDIKCPVKGANTTDKPSVIRSSYPSHPIVTDEELRKSSISKSQTPATNDVSYRAENSNSLSSSEKQEVAKFVQEETKEEGGGSISVGAIVTIVCFLVALMAASVWIAYAYKFPQTSSGQFLIKYRPSQWSLKKDGTAEITDSRHI